MANPNSTTGEIFLSWHPTTEKPWLSSDSQAVAVFGETAEEFGHYARTLAASMMRVAMVVVGLVSAVVVVPELWYVWAAAAAYLALSCLELWLVVRDRAERGREMFLLLIDSTAITCAVYGTGTLMTPVVVYYLALLVGYSVHNKQLGRAALTICLAEYFLLVLVENLGVLPHSPLLPAAAADTISLPHSIAAFALVAVGMAVTYSMLYRAMDLLERHRETREQLLFTQRNARESAFKQQLAEVHRLEAVGRLAGGVAHDFNNLLTAVVGYARLAQRNLPSDSPARPELDEIITSAERGGSLTAQLLAFSRSQPVLSRRVDLNGLLRSLTQLLTRVIGEDVHLEVRLAGSSEDVEANPGQLEQIIVNLAINARDAMPEGGDVVIETARVTLTAKDCAAHEGLEQGDYVTLSVRDDGVGMDRKTAERVFEPFFSTKEEGKGSGLGLSMVYGAVKQARGHITVRSKPGRGSVFTIYLPRKPASAEDLPATEETPLEGRGEIILLVEDEAPVLDMAARTLENHGYRVLAASDGRQALQAARESPEKIDLLLTDIVMPGMSGREVSDRLTAVQPDLPVVYMSGYPPDVTAGHGVKAKTAPLLRKPFTDLDLLKCVRRVLDRS